MILKKILIASLLILLILTGCTPKKKVEQKLECYVSAVLNSNLGHRTVISQKDAIANNFIYSFVIYDDGVLVVNDAERYKEITSKSEIQKTRSFAAILEGGINKDVLYQFNRTLDEVIFLLLKENIQYTFECTKE